LKAYAISWKTIPDRRKFFVIIEKGKIISKREDESLLKHHELYMNQVGGKIRIEQMINLIIYLEITERIKGCLYLLKGHRFSLNQKHQIFLDGNHHVLQSILIYNNSDFDHFDPGFGYSFI
jgi:hypothetical protein